MFWLIITIIALILSLAIAITKQAEAQRMKELYAEDYWNAVDRERRLEHEVYRHKGFNRFAVQCLKDLGYVIKHTPPAPQLPKYTLTSIRMSERNYPTVHSDTDKTDRTDKPNSTKKTKRWSDR